MFRGALGNSPVSPRADDMNKNFNHISKERNPPSKSLIRDVLEPPPTVPVANVKEIIKGR